MVAVPFSVVVAMAEGGSGRVARLVKGLMLAPFGAVRQVWVLLLCSIAGFVLGSWVVCGEEVQVGVGGVDGLALHLHVPHGGTGARGGALVPPVGGSAGSGAGGCPAAGVLLPGGVPGAWVDGLGQ
jgi:hypothetical protein